jgi:hypothetical protein
VSPIFLGIGFTVLITGSERLLGWKPLQLYGRFDYVKCLTIKILLCCRFYTGALVCSVYGCLYNGWSTATCLRRFIHGWRLRRGIIFPNMVGCIISRLDHHHLRRFAISQSDMYLVFSIFLLPWGFCVAVCILDMKMQNIMLKPFK